MKLVIVESPNKVKKIGGYLGQGFRVAATVGHFRDLPIHELAVDLTTMTPTYVIDPDKEDVVQRLEAAAAKASEVLIATDPDREGEAIGWHVAQVLGLKHAKVFATARRSSRRRRARPALSSSPVRSAVNWWHLEVPENAITLSAR